MGDSGDSTIFELVSRSGTDTPRLGLALRLNSFDFFTPVSSGKTNESEVKKLLAPISGPISESSDDPDTKKIPGVPVADMEGFGIKPEPSESAKILQAMSRPVIKINRLTASVPKSVPKKSKKLKPHKFNFV